MVLPRIRYVILFLCVAASATPGAAASLCGDPAPATLRSLRATMEKDAANGSRAMPRVHAEGTLPHQGIYDQSREAQKDWGVVANAALLFRAERKPADLAPASRLLADWARIYQPSFNPIDETGLDRYIDAYVLLRDDLDPTVRAGGQTFIRRLTTGYLDRMEKDFRPDKGTWINNWNSHRVKLETLGAAALDDEHLWERARRQFIAQLSHNVRADGSVVDFDERDALHYVVYDLEPLTRAALAAKARGEDWLHISKGQGISLAHALDWLVPYGMGSKTHEEFVHSKVPFDAARRNAGLPGFGGLWEIRNAASLFSMAAHLDPSYRAVAKATGPVRGWTAACFG